MIWGFWIGGFRGALLILRNYLTCDRFNPRVLLFWYYGSLGLTLVIVPFTSFDAMSLPVLAVCYGLD